MNTETTLAAVSRRAEEAESALMRERRQFATDTEALTRRVTELECGLDALNEALQSAQSHLQHGNPYSARPRINVGLTILSRLKARK